jgi:hypothetical protein
MREGKESLSVPFSMALRAPYDKIRVYFWQVDELDFMSFLELKVWDKQVEQEIVLLAMFKKEFHESTKIFTNN